MTLAPITAAMHEAARASLWARRASRHGLQYVEVLDPRSRGLAVTPRPDMCTTMRVVLTVWQWDATGRWVCYNPVEEAAPDGPEEASCQD